MSAAPDNAGPFLKYQNSGAYHHTLMERDPFYAAKIHKAVSLVRPGAVVVDVGCGDGVFVKYARGTHRACVVGIDPSEHGVRLARQMTGASKLCVGSAAQLPIRPSSADLVVMIDVVNYLPECDDAIREATRTLKPGGILVIMSPVDISLEEERLTTADSWQSRVWTVDQMRTLTERHLRVAEVTFIEKAVPTAGVGALFGLVRAMGLASIAQRIASALHGWRRQAAPALSTNSVPGGSIVLNTFSLPRLFVRRYDKLEFILIARRDGVSL
jgi:SAM-dependent methyltransferase